jgi:magnesium-transporting ATPase (P-type)
VLGYKTGIQGDINAFRASFPVLAKVPFDSDYKFVAQLHDVEPPGAAAGAGGGVRRVVYAKGAWDVLISRCATQAAGDNAWASEPIDVAFWKAAASEYAASGLRVLAVVQWEVPRGKETLTADELLVGAAAAPCLQLNCLLAIVDPCRESAGRAVRECQKAGIVVKMITGDHADTASFIAGQLGIIDKATFERYLAVKDSPDPEARRRIVLQGADIEAIPKDDPGTAVPREPHLAKYVLDVNVFARVTPEHKLRIVRALKNTHGRITSMTGDGVNDAPALKEAHVGVAMGITGTDVAKQGACQAGRQRDAGRRPRAGASA